MSFFLLFSFDDFFNLHVVPCVVIVVARLICCCYFTLLPSFCWFPSYFTHLLLSSWFVRGFPSLWISKSFAFRYLPLYSSASFAYNQRKLVISWIYLFLFCHYTPTYYLYTLATSLFISTFFKTILCRLNISPSATLNSFSFCLFYETAFFSAVLQICLKA